MDFTYNDIHIDNCVHKISPSQIDKFYTEPTIWYKEQMLGETVFKGSTSTELGTVIHAIADSVATTGAYSDLDVVDYIDSITDPDVDKDTLHSTYLELARAVINEYLVNNKPEVTEEQLTMHIKDNVYVGGTCDFRDGTIVGDYKTVSRKPSLEKIPLSYKRQLMSYARMYKEQGLEIDTIRIVYIVRPTKTLPARIFIVDHAVEYDDWVMIDNTLELIADTVLLSNKQPELRYILWKSMEYKEGRQMVFKDGGLVLQ
jgi:hypothetical protein